MYGTRARIGYTVATVTTEVFPIDWYKIVPEGVSLMMWMLPLGERSAKDVEKCYDASIEGAKNLAACGADIVLLGGLPVNMSRGDPTELMKRLSDEIGLPVTSSTTAQQKAYKALGARKVGTVHPFKPDQSFRHDKQLKDFFGLEPCGVVAGGYDLKTVGSIPLDCAFAWARKLKQENPGLDTINFAQPHWRVADAIEPLERELKVNVMTSLQAIAWEAMRTAGIEDRVEGYGKLLREH